MSRIATIRRVPRVAVSPPMTGVATAIRRVPRAAYLCALLAVVNAFVWSLLTPPFQVPDETNHYAYAQYLAETGQLPSTTDPAHGWSSEVARAVLYIGFPTTVGNAATGRPPWTRDTAASAYAQIAGFDRMSNHRDRADGGGDTAATNHPPLYHALEVVPYYAAGGGTVFDRLWAMRLLSALLEGITVLCAFLFVREVLPGTPWAWAAAALACAFQPLFSFIAGGVNNDNLMATLGSAALLVLARAFRRGLNVRRALALGVLTGLGTVTKLNFLALLPGIALGLVLLGARAPLARRAAAIRAALGSAVAAATPLVVYLVLTQTVWHRPLLGHGAAGAATLTGVNGATTTPSGGGHGLLDFMWQTFLPPLPFMNHIWFPRIYPPWDIYFKEFIGVFGWIDYSFPNWVYTVAGVIFAVLLALFVTALVRSHRALRARAGEAITYLAVVAGLLLAIARAGFPFQLQTGYVFAQARYLVPLTPLYGLFIALAIRGAGRRLGPALACVVVVLAVAHTLFAQLLTLGRFYG